MLNRVGKAQLETTNERRRLRCNTRSNSRPMRKMKQKTGSTCPASGPCDQSSILAQWLMSLSMGLDLDLVKTHRWKGSMRRRHDWILYRCMWVLRDYASVSIRPLSVAEAVPLKLHLLNSAEKCVTDKATYFLVALWIDPAIGCPLDHQGQRSRAGLIHKLPSCPRSQVLIPLPSIICRDIFSLNQSCYIFISAYQHNVRKSAPQYCCSSSPLSWDSPCAASRKIPVNTIPEMGAVSLSLVPIGRLVAFLTLARLQQESLAYTRTSKRNAAPSSYYLMSTSFSSTQRVRILHQASTVPHSLWHQIAT